MIKHCKHPFIQGYLNETLSYKPGICGVCGAMIDMRTIQAMTPMQIEQWADEQAERRIRSAKSIIYASEVRT